MDEKFWVLSDFVGDLIEVKHAYRDLHLISSKKVVYACNVEEDLGAGNQDNEFTKMVKEYAEKDGSGVVILSGKIEEELAQLEGGERQEMLDALGFLNPGLDRLILSGYRLLGLQSYFTAGEKEIRAWTIPIGAKAPQAAGVIHTDFEKGFIRAEVISYEDYTSYGSESKVKEAGKIRVEGKDYIVSDGDVMHFRFNV